MVNSLTVQETSACLCSETPENSYITVKSGLHGDDYGKPQPGTLTEMRAQVANTQICKEILQLCGIIEAKGFFNGENPNMKCILFGNLFNIYNNVSDKCVGILLRARKHKFVEFDGEMLYQRRDDDVPIYLLKPIEEIKDILKLGNNKFRDSSSHTTAVLVDQSIRSTHCGNIPQGSVDTLDTIDLSSTSKLEPLKSESCIILNEKSSFANTQVEEDVTPRNILKKVVKEKKKKITPLYQADSAASVIVVSKLSRIPDTVEEKPRIKKSFSRTKQGNMPLESTEVATKKFNNNKESRSFITNKLKIPSGLTMKSSSPVVESRRNSQMFENKFIKDRKLKKLCVPSMESAASVAIISKASKTSDSVRENATEKKSQMKTSLMKLKHLQTRSEPQPTKKPKSILNTKSLSSDINPEVIKYKNQRFNKKPSKIAMQETKVDVKDVKRKISENINKKLSKNSMIPLPVYKVDVEELKSQNSFLNMKPSSSVKTEINLEAPEPILIENINRKLLMNEISNITTLPKKKIEAKIDTLAVIEDQSCQDSVLTIVKKLESNKKKSSISEKFSNFAFKSRSSIREPTSVFQEPILVDEPLPVVITENIIEEYHYDEGEEEMTMDEYEETDGFRIFCDDTDSDSAQIEECDYLVQEESLFQWLKKVFVQFFFAKKK